MSFYHFNNFFNNFFLLSFISLSLFSFPLFLFLYILFLLLSFSYSPSLYSLFLSLSLLPLLISISLSLVFILLTLHSLCHMNYYIWTITNTQVMESITQIKCFCHYIIMIHCTVNYRRLGHGYFWQNLHLILFPFFSN